MNKFFPDFICSRVSKIPVEFLKKQGIKALLIDVDDTITEYQSLIIDKDIKDWILKIKENNIKICLFSNNNYERVKPLAEEFDVIFIAPAKKPIKKNYEKALKLLSLKKKEVAGIGDQIFTDILGANNFRIMSILVKPIGVPKDIDLYIRRKFERLILKRYYKQKREI